MNEETDDVRGSRNVAELKTGVEGRVSRSLTGAVATVPVRARFR